MKITTTELHLLKRQFLANYAVYLIQWPDHVTTVDSQSLIHDEIFDWSIQRQRLPHSQYTCSFLKRYIRKIDQSERQPEYHEGIVLLLADLCATPSPIPESSIPLALTTKTWFLDYDCQTYITTYESLCTISNGTTGLQTWPASLAMAEYLLCHPHLVSHQRVLELGSGVGMLGMVLMNHLSVSELTLSDSHAMVLKVLAKNAKFNKCVTKNVHVVKLDYLQPMDSMGSSPQVILCADTAYDPDLIPGLCACMSKLLEMYPTANVLMSCAIRRRSTFELLLGSIEQLGMQSKFLVESLDHEFSLFPCSEAGSEIALLEIYI